MSKELEKNQQLRFRLAQIIYFVTIVDFLILIINIQNVIPVLKPYDFWLLLILMIGLPLSFLVIREYLISPKQV